MDENQHKPIGKKEADLDGSVNFSVTSPLKKKDPITPSPSKDTEEVTRESPAAEVAGKLIVEPVAAELYHLTYACLLVPRLSTYVITDDLMDRLDEWMLNICEGLGWKLEYLAVRPEYLQWVVTVQPNISPGYLMRNIRIESSKRIFATFPHLKKNDFQNDFWAPGYLIMGGAQPHPLQLVEDYIRLTRQRQGEMPYARLAGDETTDAPPPNVKKKKPKGK
jgi:REP element-mobilizing transposase RayT